MRKYLQITIVLGGFFLLVLLRNLKGSDDENVVVGSPQITPVLQNTTQTVPQATPTPVQSGPQPQPQAISGKYKDGTYTGTVEDAYYGNIQVQAVISNGKLSDVLFLQYPNDNRTSRSINLQALPILKSEAIQAQSATIDIVSGASDTSPAFSRSLAAALRQAQ